MIGYYNYTVILTYLSLLSASIGTIVTISGHGHPYFGIFFLLFCGLCDAFDGKVARHKKNRTESEKCFGIQIDSLSDLVAFGVLPACVGISMMRLSPLAKHYVFDCKPIFLKNILFIGVHLIPLAYILAAMIRLAYFNVTEQERQKNDDGVRKFYTGLPVTSASLIFPFILLLQFVIKADVAPVYFLTLIIVGIAFLSRFRIRKPGFKGIMMMVGIGAIEFALILIGRIVKC